MAVHEGQNISGVSRARRQIDAGDELPGAMESPALRHAVE
jgi:hypothetical protein